MWFCRSVAWTIYQFTVDMDLGKVGASFLGSLILGLLSHVMSRRYKRPVIIFIVPGIIPLVPGGTAYEATRYLVSNDYTQAVNTFRSYTYFWFNRIRHFSSRNPTIFTHE